MRRRPRTTRGTRRGVVAWLRDALGRSPRRSPACGCGARPSTIRRDPVRPPVRKTVRFKLTNQSGYDTSDLRRFFSLGLRALGVREPKEIVVVAAPARSRGCAEVGGNKEGQVIVISVAPPSRFRLRRLARLFEHEVAHVHGLSHEDMDHRTMWSLGPVPGWAKGAKIRYRGRAPSQIP